MSESTDNTNLVMVTESFAIGIDEHQWVGYQRSKLTKDGKEGKAGDWSPWKPYKWWPKLEQALDVAAREVAKCRYLENVDDLVAVYELASHEIEAIREQLS